MKSIKNSFQNKLILLLLFSIVIPISISIIVTYQYTKTTIKDSYITNNSTLLFHGSQNFTNYLSQLNQASLIIYNDMRDEKSFHQIIISDEIGFVLEQNLFVNLQYMTNSFADIMQVYLYFNRSDTSHRYAYNIKRHADAQSYPINIPEDKDFWIEPSHLSHTYNINKFPYEHHEPVISLHKNILNLPSNEILGTVSIDVKLSTIIQMSKLLYNNDEEQLFIVNEDGQSIFRSHDIEDEILHSWLHQIDSSTSSKSFFEYNDNSFSGIHLYEKINSQIGNWTIIKRIPYEYLYSNARELTLINSLIMSLFLVVSIICVLYISFSFTSPIKYMLKYINQIEIGKVNTKLDTKRTDEIGILSRRFYQLIQNLNHAINNEYKLVLANRTNQLKALQAQINPHFLNNALQSIGTLALQNNQKKIYNLITSLGKMMRYQMNTSELPVVLQSEIDYVTSYLQLQSQRFEDQLHYFFKIEDATKKIEVPRMILQPIVENCFKHGFVKHNNNGVINIKAKVENKTLIITVEDNGVGIHPTHLQSLTTQLNSFHMTNGQFDYEGHSIGLFNIQARLQLYYHNHASLLLEQNSPNGLIVKIVIHLESGDINI